MNLRSFFREEVFFPRMLMSICWTLILEFAFSSILIFLLSFSFWNPLSTILSWLGKVFSLSSIWCHILCGASTVFVAFLHTLNYTVTPRIPLTFLAIAWSILRPKHLMFIVLHMIAGGILAHCFVGHLISDLHGISINCPESTRFLCLNEDYLVIILFGGMVALTFGASYFLKHQYCIDFPTVQQLKFLAIKCSLKGLIRQSAVSTLFMLKWFCFFYLLLGSHIRIWLCEMFELQMQHHPIQVPVIGESNLLLTLQRLMNINLLWAVVLTGTFINFILKSFLLLFRVFMTERIYFEIDASPEGEKKVTLNKALTCKEEPIIQHLAYLDLQLLARESPSRRSQLYAISKPGGHPYNWDSVHTNCLSLIEHFMRKLNNDSSKEVGPSSLRETGKGSDVKIYGSSSPFHLLKAWLLKKRSQVLETLTTKFHFSRVIFNEFPEAKMGQLFVECQTLIWAIECLSFLVAYSVKEDHYGVVQKVLPILLTRLFDLQMGLERYQKRASVPKRLSKVTEELQKEVALKRKLKMTLTSALYRITLAFGPHIEDVPLPADYKPCLMRYMEFKE